MKLKSSLKNKKIFLLIFCFNFNLFFGEEKTIEADKLVSDNEKDWSIALVEFEDKGLLPSQSYLLRSIPLLFYQQISECKTHILQKEEKKELALSLLENEIFSVKRQISKKQKDLDTLFFDREDTEQKKKKIRAEIRDLYLKLEQLRLLRGLKENISIGNEKPIKFIKKNEEDILFPAINKSPFKYLKEKKLDMILSGYIEQIEGLIYYKVELYSAFQKKIVYTVYNGGNYNEIAEQIKKDSIKLIEAVLGRPWASLVIETFPLSATIRFDDGEKGVGIMNRPFIHPKVYKIRLDSAGYIPEEIEVELINGETRNITLRMQKDLANPIVLQTFPQNADVYLSAQWIGKTPLLVENAGNSEPFVFRKEGYNDYYGSIEDISEELYLVQLDSSKFLSEELLYEKKIDVYNALTTLAIGVPFFIFGFGFDKKYAEYGTSNVSTLKALSAGDFNKDYFEIATTRSVFTILNQVGLTIVTASAINLIIEMIEYVSLFDKM